jgi:hypothetical protein
MRPKVTLTPPGFVIVGVAVGVSVGLMLPISVVGVAVGGIVAIAPLTAITCEHVVLTAPELSVNTEVEVKLPPELYVWAS